MSKILLPIGEMMLFLGLWIARWDIRNEFLLWLLGGVISPRCWPGAGVRRLF